MTEVEKGSQATNGEPNGGAAGEAQPKLEGDELLAALNYQLEYYFSRSNLAKDSFLLSQMDEQKFVSIDLIANFRKVKMLTEDKAIILAAMRQCKNLTLDSAEKMVRPTLKMERNTLILRDIPADTPVEDIKKIFDDDENCGKALSVHSDIGDTWFVTFATEGECMDTAMHLSNVQFQGKQIRCRVKSANLRGFYSNNAGTPKGAGRGGGGGGGGEFRGSSPSNVPMRGNGNFYPNMYNGNPYMNAPYGYGNVYGQNYMYGNYHGGYNGGDYKAQGGGRGRGKGRPDGQYSEEGGAGRGKREQRERQGGQGENWKNRERNNRKQGNRQQKEDGGNRRPNSKAAAAAAAAAAPAPQPQPQLEDPGDFPALPGKTANAAGYGSKSFKKYDRDTMAAAVEAVVKKGYSRPAKFVEEFNSVLLSKPIVESQLLEPMPVIYPASPSPLLAAQTVHSSQVPFLDLNSYGNPYLPPDKSSMSFSAAAELPAAVTATPKTNQKAEAKTETTKKEEAGTAKATTGKKARKNKTSGANKKASGDRSNGEKNQPRRSKGGNRYAQKPTKAAAAPAQAAPAQAAPAEKQGPPLSPSKMSYAQMAKQAAEKRASESAKKE